MSTPSHPAGRASCRLTEGPARPRRLICFPYAGAGTSAYRAWPAALDAHTDVYAMQPAGHEERFGERRFTDLRACSSDFLPALTQLADRPCVFFGHSLGALVAYECARQLQDAGHGPAHLVVSGMAAPHARLPAAMRELSDAALVEQLRAYNGTPRQLLDSPELLAIYLPILRDDLCMSETYDGGHAPGTLRCPVTCLHGASDPRVTRAAAERWRETTAGAFALAEFPGDHFYIHPQLQAVVRRLEQVLPAL